MNSILSIEWLKIKKYRTFWILTGLFVVLFPIWSYAISNGFIKVGPGINLFGSNFSFGDIWNNVTAHASNFIIFIAILIAILVTNEYAFRTSRQNIIDGWSRLQFLHSKWLVVLTMAACTTVFVFITGLIMGLVNGASWSGFGSNMIRLLWMFLLSANYLGFAMLLGLLVKRSGLAISLLVIYSLMLENILHLYMFYGKHLFAADLFLPLQCSDQLLQISTIEHMTKMGGLGSDISDWAYAAATVCWIGIYYMIGRYRLLRSDW